ncbi:MAG: hypothetical protein QXF61_10480 [Nitrososphaeria archaeon]
MITWEKIPDSALIYLDSKLGHKLIKEAIKRSGSKRFVIKYILLYSGRSPDVTKLDKMMKGDCGIPKYRFTRLIAYLRIPPEESLRYIQKICTKTGKVLYHKNFIHI